MKIVDILCANVFYARMTPLEHIRRNIFKENQTTFGEIAGTTQPSVCRWEKGEQKPDLAEMERIRTAARKRGLAWDDRWFFELPAEQGAAA